MPHRIVYCALGCASLLGHLHHEALRHLNGGVVVSVSDEVMSTLMGERNISIMYFSRYEYDEALKGLSEPEIEAALRKRLQQWSPRAIDHSISWIAHDARRSLTLTAQAARAAFGNTAKLLET